MKRKIIILLAAIFAFLSGGIFMAILYITDVTDELNRIIKLHQVEQQRRTLLINLQSVQSNLYTFKTSLAQNLDVIVDNMDSLEKTSGNCSACHHPAPVRERIQKIQGLIRDYQYHISYYITIRANEKRMLVLKNESALIGEKIQREIQNMSHIATKSLEGITIKTSDNIRTIIRILFITLILAIGISVFLAIRLIRSIIDPIQVLLNATGLISSGGPGS